MASQGDGLVGDPHQSFRSHRNTEGIRTERSKTWTKTHKKVMEIMSGLCIHTSPEEKLSVEEIIKKADVMFKNMHSPATKNQNFAVRLRNVLSNSHFFFPLQNSSSANASVWELAAGKIADFKQMVNTFVEENSELAEEHEIKNSSHYNRSRKRGSNAISTPDAVKSSVPKKKKSSVKTDAKGKRRVLPTERTKPHFSSLPNAVGQMKNKVATASALAALKSTPMRVEFNVEKETSRAREIDMLSGPRKYEELLKHLVGLQDIEKDIIALVTKKEEERLRFYQEQFSRFEKEMNQKLEAVTIRVLKVLEQHEHNKIDEMQAKNLVSVGINTAREPPVGNYPGEIIIDLNTQEKYTIVNFLGDGCFGKVFKATDSDERTFAIKVYTEAVSAEDTQRQLTEAIRFAVERGDHPPRFLTVSDYFDGLVFGEPKSCEKMECFALDIFEALYERDITFTPLQTLQVVAQISTALAYLHSHDYIHVDVKPDNLMLMNMDILDGKIDARLIDFDGVLKMNGQPTLFCGQSVPYRSPEMALELPCDGKLDVFSLGLVALQMVTGQNGFYMISDAAVEGFEEWETNAAILAEIHSLISPIPHDLLQRSNAFRDVTEFKKIVGQNKKTMEEICTDLESSSDGAFLASVIRSMLIVDPHMRPSAADISENLAEFCTPHQHEI